MEMIIIIGLTILYIIEVISHEKDKKKLEALKIKYRINERIGENK